MDNTMKALSYSPLHHHSIEELQAIKQYLVENLYKGFVDASKALFTTLILFVKKLNKLLQFCINFQKLNKLTYKDQYPLPLIKEALARLRHAYVFTKLDICQAFHQICMDSELKELTTF
jgi:hypothetical protein